ncbi:hypothetical protein Bbelb_397350 [Branchiostoma belcheri]|nr:hypothetical protein Bbelb_397350 [Branchiostoma belcheri]
MVHVLVVPIGEGEGGIYSPRPVFGPGASPWPSLCTGWGLASATYIEPSGLDGVSNCSSLHSSTIALHMYTSGTNKDIVFGTMRKLYPRLAYEFLDMKRSVTASFSPGL